MKFVTGAMFGSQFNPEEPAATFRRAREELERKTIAHMQAWGLGKTERWDADLDLGVISFSGDGRIVTAPVQVVGTYYSVDGTWLWGWDHPTVDEPLAHDARLARAFGERYGLGDYTTRLIECTEEQAWQFTAVACHLAKAAGAYRGPAGDTFIFMTFHDVTIGRQH